jgi:hypothetical protein
MTGDRYRQRIAAALILRSRAVATTRRVWRSWDAVVQRTLLPHHVQMTRWGVQTSPASDRCGSRTNPDFALSPLDRRGRILPSYWAVPRTARDQGPVARSACRRVAGCQEQAGNLLRNASSEAPCRVGARRVAEVAAWVDPAAESPGESLSRARLITAGVPRPVVGLPVTGDDGRSYVADLAWLPQRVIGEVDGSNSRAGTPAAPGRFARGWGRFFGLMLS